jgi:hypothetical protein
MATIFYIRKGSKQNKIASSRDVSVEDLLSLYGSAPSSYKHMKGVDSPTVIGNGPASPDPDAEHVVVRIEGNEVNRDTFPEEGFYKVNVTPETEY